MAANVMEIYGSKVFNEHVMKERLPSATYKSLKNTLHKGAPLDIEVANVVASVMKRWAMELGATHYTDVYKRQTTPSVAHSAPQKPPCEAPMKVAILMADVYKRQAESFEKVPLQEAV